MSTSARAIVLLAFFLIFSANSAAAAWYDPVVDFFGGLMGLDAGDPIGYEYVENDTFLHTWNQNPYEDRRDIWFNVSQNYMQFFNGLNYTDAVERSSWATHRFGIARYNPTFEFYTTDFDPTHHIESDNTTYWNQSLEHCVHHNRCFGFKRGQELESEYMRNSLFGDWTGQVNFDPWYVWQFVNVSIENDETQDTVLWCNMTADDEGTWFERCGEFSNDNTNTFEIDNITQFALLDSYTERGHYIIANGTPLRLRYEGDGQPMLLSQVDLNNNYDQIDLHWIDFRDFYNISVDKVNEVSGYIRRIGGAYVPYNNTDARSGYDDRFIGDLEYRAYFGFNITSIPENASIQSIRLWVQGANAQPTNNGPADWITDFWVCGDGCISDGNGLKIDDWSDGNDTTRTVNWDSDGETQYFCGSNSPCDTWVTLFHNNTIYGNTMARDELQIAMDNPAEDWFHVMMVDDSAYTSNQYWYWVFVIATSPANKVPMKLEINYSLAEINMSLLAPANQSIFPEGARVNFTWDANASLGLDSCNITLDNDLYQFNSTKVAYDETNKSKCTGNWDVSFPCVNVNDTNWNTYGQANIFSISSFWANYTRPDNAKRFPEWEVKDDGGRVNLTIPEACWDDDWENISIGMVSSRAATPYARWYCYASHWTPQRILLRDYGFGTKLYEDKMWWSIMNNSNYTKIYPTAGTYNWTVRCNDTSGNFNTSETRWFDINTPPNTPTPLINSSFNRNKTTENLTCNDTLLDINNQNINGTIRWYNNSVLWLNYSFGPYANGTQWNNTLHSDNTTKDDNWTCELKFEDTLGGLTDWVNSSVLFINNTPPGQVNLTAPTDNSTILFNATPNLDWNASADNDSDVLYYTLIIDDDVAFGTPDVNVTNINNTNYTNQITLTEATWNWKVRSNDNDSNGTWSNIWNFTLKFNDFPIVQSNSLDPASPLTTDDLNCSYTITDDSYNGTITPEIRWYKDTLIHGVAVNYTALNNTLNSTLLTNVDTTKGEVWICGITPYDNLTNGTQLNTSSVTIQNSLPGNVTLVSPMNSTYVINVTPNFLWEAAIDNDTDSLTYQIQIDDTIDFSSTVYDVSSIPDTNYTNQVTLVDGTEYFWRVRANDGVGDGAWVTHWNFTIDVPITVGDVNITLLSPISSNYTKIDVLHNNTFVNFTYNVSSKYNVSNCTLWINRTISNYTAWYNESLNYTNHTIVSNTTNMFRVLVNRTGNYSWQVNCTDNVTGDTGQAGMESTRVIGHEPFIYATLFLVTGVLVFVGERKKDWILRMVAGTLILIIGVYTFSNGIPGEQVSWFAAGYPTGWIFYASMILIGFGMFYIFRAVYTNVWGFEDDGN